MFNPTWFYLGAVYAAAIALARRRCGIEIPRRTALFFYALVLVFFYRPLTQSYVNAPVDFLKSLPPWQLTTRESFSLNGQMNDIPLQIIPWAHQVRESWRSLEPPLWNALSACGYPLLANGQSSALSPLRILGLPLSLGNAMTFESSMKILIALTFMFLWCRRRGYSEMASTIGAVSFGFSMFIIVWLHFPIVSTACLVPAIFYLLDLLIERQTFPRIVALAAAGAAMLFGGHPETMSHTAFFALAYVLWATLVERRMGGTIGLRPIGRLAGAIGIAAVLCTLLAARLLLPLAEALPNSKRFHELKAAARGSELPWSDRPSAILLVQPHFFGEMPHEAWGPAHTESLSGFAGSLAVAAWFGLLAHVIVKRRWRSTELFLLLGSAFAVCVVLSVPGFHEFFNSIFQWAANSRIRLFLGFFLAGSTAAMIDLITRDRASFLTGIAASAALILYILLATRFEFDYRRDTAVLGMLQTSVVLAIATLVASARRHTWTILILLVAVIAELWEVGRDWNPVVRDKWMYPKTPIIEALDALKATTPPEEPYRIAGAGAMLFPNTSARYGHADIRAHDPMSNGRYIGALRLVTNYDTDEYFARWQDWHKRFIDFLNARWIVATPGFEMPPRYILRHESNDGRIFENPAALPRFYPVRDVFLDQDRESFYRHLQSFDDWANGAWLDDLEPENDQMTRDLLTRRRQNESLASARILVARDSEYRVHVRAPRYTLVVSSIAWWPGWKVERNGVEFDPIRVNGAFLGFAVPAGEVDVRVWFDPWTFRYGGLASLVTMVGLIVFAKTRARQVQP